MGKKINDLAQNKKSLITEELYTDLEWEPVWGIPGEVMKLMRSTIREEMDFEGGMFLEVPDSTMGYVIKEIRENDQRK